MMAHCENFAWMTSQTTEIQVHFYCAYLLTDVIFSSSYLVSPLPVNNIVLKLWIIIRW